MTHYISVTSKELNQADVNLVTFDCTGNFEYITTKRINLLDRYHTWSNVTQELLSETGVKVQDVQVVSYVGSKKVVSYSKEALGVPFILETIYHNQKQLQH